MENPKIVEVRSWLEKSQQDLDAATWLLTSPHHLFNAVGFHSQQAAEKSLKANLCWMDMPFEKTHSLVALVGLCLKVRSEFETLRTAATTLTPFAVTTRDPGDLPEISQQEALEGVEYAKQIWKFILAQLPEETHLQ